MFRRIVLGAERVGGIGSDPLGTQQGVSRVSEEGNATVEDDEIHPLDRDYSVPVPPMPRRLVFRDARAIYLGVIGFVFGGLVLLVGIAASQFGDANRTMEGIAGSAHRMGMWSILAGGVSLMHGMRTRANKHVRKRRSDVLAFVMQAKDNDEAYTIRDWRHALADRDELVCSDLCADLLRPELEDVYLVVGDDVLAVLRWDSEQGGIIRVRVRRRDVSHMGHRCWELLHFLDAKLVEVK